MRISLLISALIISAAPSFAQPLYNDPAGNAGSGPDLLSILATDTASSWDFRLQFQTGTLDPFNFAFNLILDTDLLGTPSVFSGAPSTPGFGDDLYITYNSISGPSAMVIAKLSETEAAIVGSIDLQWKSDELSFSVFRTFTAPTTGNAEFIILMGLPTDESGFEVSQKLPAQFGQELSTTTIPEPAAYSVILSVFSVILTLLRVRTKRQNVQ